MGDFSVEFKKQISAAMLADLAGSVPLSVTGQDGRSCTIEAPFDTDKASLKSLRRAIEQVTGKNSVEALDAAEE